MRAISQKLYPLHWRRLIHSLGLPQCSQTQNIKYRPLPPPMTHDRTNAGDTEKWQIQAVLLLMVTLIHFRGIGRPPPIRDIRNIWTAPNWYINFKGFSRNKGLPISNASWWQKAATQMYGKLWKIQTNDDLRSFTRGHFYVTCCILLKYLWLDIHIINFNSKKFQNTSTRHVYHLCLDFFGPLSPTAMTLQCYRGVVFIFVISDSQDVNTITAKESVSQNTARITNSVQCPPSLSGHCDYQ